MDHVIHIGLFGLGGYEMTENNNHPSRPYFKVLLVLAVLTVIEVSITYGPLSEAVLLWILLAIAFAKANTVIAFYMHVKYEPKPWLLYTIVFVLPFLLAFPLAFYPVVG
ncbi:MAG: hypothetical protein D6732_11475 [Methanobacteriota archaeon]|nr:MAG: hypothetical protein D6732_11475 [Euryarchaeota archaeon]